MCDFDDDHYTTIKQRQQYADKAHIYKDFTIIPVESTVVVKREEQGPWVHGTLVEQASRDHNSISCKV